MAYKIGFREAVMLFIDNGHTREEAHKEFKVSVRTLENWEVLRKTNGSLELKELVRVPKKLPEQELLQWYMENPDAYLRETAEHFNCSAEAVRKAEGRYGISVKKRAILRGAR